MIIDASACLAIFRDYDVHQAVSIRLVEAASAAGEELRVPDVALAEISGVIARHTGNARLARRTLNAVLALPRLQRYDFMEPMADRGAALAASCKLRRADAVDLSPADALKRPLSSLDEEILERSPRCGKAITPADGLHLPEQSPAARRRG
jgi:predicted nucleic acid-binding protein